MDDGGLLYCVRHNDFVGFPRRAAVERVFDFRFLVARWQPVAVVEGDEAYFTVDDSR